MTAASADERCTERWIVAIIWFSSGLRRLAESVAEEVDGVMLEAEPHVGVHRGGHDDVGVPQQLLDDDQFDTLLP